MPHLRKRLKSYLLLALLLGLADTVSAWNGGGFSPLGQGLLIIGAFAVAGFLLAEVLLYLAFRATARRLEKAVALQAEELRKQAVRDELTGLYNRRYLEELMEKERARARRFKQAMSLVLLDLDHFKAINDEFGHLVGDHALRETATLIRKRIRTSDYAFRFGGEEFLIVLTGTPLQSALEICEDLRALLESTAIAELPAGRVTASFGVTEMASGRIEALDDMVKRADEAMYRAKAAGRNRVVASPPPQAGL